MADPMDDSQAQASRSSQFSDGIAGGGAVASSLPQVAQASPDFDSSGSVLTAANAYSGLGLGSSDSTMRIANPYGLAMRDSLRATGSGKVPE
jgi:hypothetical protein